MANEPNDVRLANGPIRIFRDHGQIHVQQGDKVLTVDEAEGRRLIGGVLEEPLVVLTVRNGVLALELRPFEPPRRRPGLLKRTWRLIRRRGH